MTIALCLLADRRMLRVHIKRALSECGVRHIAEDRDGLFGEFSPSRLYFCHNDTGRTAGDRPSCPQKKRQYPHVQMVFHYAPAQLERGGTDLCLFLDALARHCENSYLLLLDGHCVWIHEGPKRIHEGPKKM
jgi:hypothetical protein